MAARLCLCIPLVAFFLFLAGCSYPPAIHTYEYVTAYDRMSDSYDPILSLVYVPRPTAFSNYLGVVIGDVRVGDIWVESPQEALGYATFLRVALRSELTKLKKFAFVSLDKDGKVLGEQLRAHALLVEGMITKFDRGSGLKRYLSYFLWFLQSGATDLQFEGRITDAATGRLIVEFVDRRRNLCNTPFGPNPNNFKRGYAMKVTARDMALCLAKFIDMGYERLPAVSVSRKVDGLAEATSEEMP